MAPLVVDSSIVELVDAVVVPAQVPVLELVVPLI